MTNLSPATGFSQDPHLAERYKRIAGVLGVRLGELPEVTPSAAGRFYAYLTGVVSFPFAATYNESVSSFEEVPQQVIALGLIPPGDNSDEVLCRVLRGGRQDEVPLAELEVHPSDPNYRPLEDYWFWVWNGRQPRSATGTQRSLPGV